MMLNMDYSKIQPIIEIYTCLQGEGRDTGKPMILVRMSGCRLRCQFSDTSFCDTAYASWKPDKGQYTLNDVVKIIRDNPQIKHLLITGGGPTLNPTLLTELVNIGNELGKYVCIETEGSEFVQTRADFISLSPKLANSSPRIGTKLPFDNERLVTEKDFAQHEKWRRSYDAMERLISQHKDYQFKPVITCEADLLEVRHLIKILSIPPQKVWIMPEGTTSEELDKNRKWLVDVCIREGWNFTDRLHVTIFGNKRLV